MYRRYNCVMFGFQYPLIINIECIIAIAIIILKNQFMFAVVMKFNLFL
jgi:hypothetical protein